MGRTRTGKPLASLAAAEARAQATLRALISPVSFWSPEQLGPQSAWLEHAPFAFWLVEALAPRTIVELGTHGGFSYFAFCQAVQQLELDSRCFAVDTWEGDQHAGFYGEKVFEEVRAHNERLYAAFSTLIRSTFEEAATQFRKATVDLLHIDGRHFYEDAKRDFETWRPKLSDRGVVLFHDINVRERGFGVFRLWEELRERHPGFEFLHGNGLGVLGVGSRLPQSLRELFAATGAAAATAHIRSAYGRLGSAVALQFTAAQDQRIAERQKQELTQWPINAAALRQDIAHRVADADRLHETIASRSADAARLEGELAAARGRAAELDGALAARAAEAMRLAGELAAAGDRATNFEAGLTSRSAKAARLAGRLASETERATDLESALAARAAEAARLAGELMRATERTTSLEAALAARSTETARLSGDLATATDWAEKLGREYTTTTERARNLEVTLASRSAEAARLAADLADVKNRAANLEAELASRTAELEIKMAAVTERSAEAGRLAADLADVKNRAKNLEAELASRTAEFATKMATATDRARELEASRAAQGQEIQAIKSSVSWRLTSFLRTMARRFPRTTRRLHRPLALLWRTATLRFVSRLRAWRRRRLAIRLIQNSRLFDRDWYLRTYPDVGQSGMDPKIHYLEHGGIEGRDPSPYFNGRWYLDRSPDVRAEGLNPLIHYLRYGAREGRSPRPNFDSDGYLRRNPDAAAAGSDALAHFMRPGAKDDVERLALQRLSKFPAFDSDCYLAAHSDVGGLDPNLHFLRSIDTGGRTIVKREDCIRLVTDIKLSKPERSVAKSVSSKKNSLSLVGIYVSSQGNVFMRELAEDLAADLRTCNVNALLLDENSQMGDRPAASIFVAPHEFFVLGRGEEWIRDDILASSFMFGTEQVQTKWFSIALPMIMKSRGVIDICYQTSELFRSAGIPAFHLLPGLSHRPDRLSDADMAHPLFRALPRSAKRDYDVTGSLESRVIDISFFGAISPRRETFFSRNAKFFAALESCLYCRTANVPLSANTQDGALTRIAAHVAGHSKIALNIHQDVGYFELHRMVKQGMCLGSVVVSDRCLPNPLFTAGEHYLEDDLNHLPDLIEYLLHTSEGRREAERVRTNATHRVQALAEDHHAIEMFVSFLNAQSS